MNILIKNGHLVDPSQEIDEVCDILIEDGKIKEIQIRRAKGKGKAQKRKNTNQPVR